MALQCLLRNYNDNDYKNLNLNLGKNAKSLDKLVERIIAGLEKQKSFSISRDTSEDEERFEASIKPLIDKIRKDVDTNYGEGKFPELEDALYNHLMEYKHTATDKAIMAVISGTDLITEGERQERTFRDIVKEILGTSNKHVYATMEQVFGRDMRKRTIINNELLITSKSEMNSAIEKYLAELYHIIREFLQKHDIGQQLTSVMGRSLYIDHKINPSSENTLLIMYNYIEDLKRRRIFDEVIREDWENKMLNDLLLDEISLYDAVDAYIKLAYFDDYLGSVLGGYIKVNDKMDAPIEIDKNGEYHYKYSFISGNISAIKTWGLEERDAIAEMAKFSKVLIESIPLYNRKDHTAYYNTYLSVKDFVNTMAKLFDLIPQLGGNETIYNALIDFKSSPAKSMKVIFSELFSKQNSESLLISKGFDENYLNYLYSIYKTVFAGNNSWYKIESKYKKTTGIPNTYSIFDTILGEMNSNVFANYIDTIYDRDGVKTEIKAKYNVATTIFLVRDNANSLIDLSSSLKREYLNKYNLISDTDYGSYTISIGSNNISITPVRDGASLLDKPLKSTSSIEILVNSLDKDNISLLVPDLSKELTRLRIISGLKSEDEEKLLQLLLFLDDMLGTRFSKDAQGLYSFYLMQRSNKNSLREMLASASRGLLITQIYDGFETALKSDGTKYNRNELLSFLKEHQGDYVNINLDYLKYDKEYFKEVENEGLQMIVVYGKEKWLEDYSKVQALLHGETSKATINSLTGKKYPNYTPSFLGSSLWFLIQQAAKKGLATSPLLFSHNIDKINVVGINSEVRTKYGIKKRILDLNNGELLYDSIVNKFIVPSLQNKYYSLPSTYSDKTKFIIYEIALKELLEGRDIYDQKIEDYIEDKMINTIGEMYRRSWNNMLQDYIKLISYLNSNPDTATNITITSAEIHNELVLNINTLQLNNWLKTLSEKKLMEYVDAYNDNHNDHLTISLETHYRIGKNGLTLNELTNYYANVLYNSLEALHARLYKEKLAFANNLLKYRVKFLYDFAPDSVDPIARVARKVLGNDLKAWLSGSYLAIGRVKLVDGTYRLISYGKVNLQEGETFELNPILNSYFLADNLIGNNLRYTLTGSEINHKIKSLKNLDLTEKFLPHLNRINALNGDPDNKILTFYDILSAISKMQEPTVQDKAIITLFNNLIYAQENLGQNALFKRNVPIPGTIRPYTLKCINGMAPEMNIAVVKDVAAKIFNFDGLAATEDAHDGSAWINPIASLLENWSLQSSEVGTIKKPIHHWMDDRYGTATLLKYAVDTMTNQWMRLAEGNENGIVIRNLVKKMLGVRWSENGAAIDLINGCGFRQQHKIDFTKDILNGGSLYYKKGLEHYKVQDFGIENGVYYTIEAKCDAYGIIDTRFEKLKVFHYFDDLGNHYTEDGEGRHTIDSLYELHTVLGGIFSESEIDGKLLYSEVSNEAVARWCNYVAVPKEGTDLKNSPIDQDYYDLPLKRMMVHMVANSSAVKNGAGNINQSERLYNDHKLSYMTIGTEYYGILLDADHTADEAQMTEFSQVISSLDAGGALHDYVSDIYKVLGLTALSMSLVELDGVAAFKTDGNKTHLYEVVGRTILDNLSGSNSAGLTESIIDNIKREFDLQADHTLDKIKLPFSDPNIYSLILPTFVSIINKKSIKRLYPGSGTVMVPGYDLSMIYDINGETYLYEDILKRAYAAGITSTNLDLYLANKEVVSAYLRGLLQQLAIIGVNDIMPTDNIYALYTEIDGSQVERHVSLNDIFDYYAYTNSNFNLFGIDSKLIKDKVLKFSMNDDNTLVLSLGANTATLIKTKKGTYQVSFNILPNTLNLNLLIEAAKAALPINAKAFISGNLNSDIYAIWSNGFTPSNRTVSAILDGVEVDIPIVLKTWGQTTLQKDITRPRNLAPAKVSFIVDGKRMNIYQHWRLKGLFLALEKLSKSNLSEDEKKAEEKRLRKYYNPQLAFEEIYNHLYIDETEAKLETEEGIPPIGKEVTGIENLPAELIVSNLYATKFGLSPYTSMADVTEESMIRTNQKRTSDLFDIVFTGDIDSYISLRPLYDNSRCKRTSWKKSLVPFTEYPADYKGERNIVNSIYAVSDDNVRLFEIGREIKVSNVKMERDGNGKALFYEINGKGDIVVENGKNKKAKGTYKIGTDGSILKVVQFVTKYRVKEKGKKSIAYEINKDAIVEAFVKRQFTEKDLILNLNGKPIKVTPEQKIAGEANNFIGILLSKIYQSFDHNGVLLRTTANLETGHMLSLISGNTLSSAWIPFINRLSYDPSLYNYLTLLGFLLKAGKKEKGYVFNAFKLGTLLRNYNKDIAKDRYVSYLKSKYFTVSRIPAQTLQSFMLMKAVGFTLIPSLLCFVSHWLTWLQGSDYKRK